MPVVINNKLRPTAALSGRNPDSFFGMEVCSRLGFVGGPGGSGQLFLWSALFMGRGKLLLVNDLLI